MQLFDTLIARRGVVAGLLGGIAAGAVSGCAGGTADFGSSHAEVSPSQVIIAMSTANEPDAGFDPCVNWGCGEHVHEPLIQSTLVVTTADMGFENDLAVSYECSTDHLTWTFEIRDDAVFSDGEPLTARDVAFTVNTIRESKTAQADLSCVERAEAVSDTVVELHLSKPFNALLYTLAVMGIVPEHAYGSDYGENPIGSGRYVLSQWDRGQQAIFEVNPAYYGEAPAIERVVVLFMEEDAALAAVRAGQVDVAYTSATFADQSIDGFELQSFKTVDSRGISLPVIASGATREDGANSYPAGNDVTSCLEIRRAINYGIDRETLIDNVLSGHGRAAYSIGDGLPWASDDMKVACDQNASIALLEDAGWELADDGIRVRDGKRAAFDLYYATGDTVRQAMASEFANQMRELGIEVTVVGAAWDDIYPREFSDPVMWGWGSNSPTDVYELCRAGGTMNFACYEDEMTDSYLDCALAQDSVEDSYPYWHKAEWDGEGGVAPQGAAAWVWLANIDHLYWVREGLRIAEQKLQPHGHGWSLLNNVDSWSWI